VEGENRRQGGQKPVRQVPEVRPVEVLGGEEAEGRDAGEHRRHDERRGAARAIERKIGVPFHVAASPASHRYRPVGSGF
jgi:hypothetical protein